MTKHKNTNWEIMPVNPKHCSRPRYSKNYCLNVHEICFGFYSSFTIFRTPSTQLSLYILSTFAEPVTSLKSLLKSHFYRIALKWCRPFMQFYASPEFVCLFFLFFSFWLSVFGFVVFIAYLAGSFLPPVFLKCLPVLSLCITMRCFS